MVNSQTGQAIKKDPSPEITVRAQRSRVFSLWLSWQELNSRKVIFSINVILIALLIALPVSLDFVGKARKTSIGSRIDYIGPSLILVPEGILSSDLVTSRLKGKTFSASLFDTVRKGMLPYLRGTDVRLTDRLSVNDREMPLTGIDFENVYSYPFSGYSLRNSEVLLGSVAAGRLKRDRGDSIRIKSETFTIAGLLPTSGSIEDASVFLPLHVLQILTGQEGQVNEIRLFPESASSYEKLKPLLEKSAGNVHVIDAYRGDTAERDVDRTLIDYQEALYTVAFILIALCIMISTYINLDSRGPEVSSIHTLGAARGIIFQVLTFRTVWIAALGALIGHGIAIVIAAFQDLRVPLRLIWSMDSFIKVTLITVFLGVLVTIPFAFYSVYKKNHLEHL